MTPVPTRACDIEAILRTWLHQKDERSVCFDGVRTNEAPTGVLDAIRTVVSEAQDTLRTLSQLPSAKYKPTMAASVAARKNQ